jgi:hypothetical protein
MDIQNKYLSSLVEVDLLQWAYFITIDESPIYPDLSTI